MNHIRVRIKESGQVLDMVPDVARAMIAGGSAVSVGQVATPKQPESAMLQPRAEQALSQRKPAAKKGR